VKIAIGSDHAGFPLKEQIRSLLVSAGHDVTDMGTHSTESVHYPVIGKQVAENVASGEYERGILVCGTGIGMCMAANRVPGIRAALCHDVFTARMSREHNDANVLCLGGRVIGPGLADEMVRIWIETPFAGGRHADRIAMLDSDAGGQKRPIKTKREQRKCST